MCTKLRVYLSFNRNKLNPFQQNLYGVLESKTMFRNESQMAPPYYDAQANDFLHNIIHANPTNPSVGWCMARSESHPSGETIIEFAITTKATFWDAITFTRKLKSTDSMDDTLIVIAMDDSERHGYIGLGDSEVIYTNVDFGVIRPEITKTTFFNAVKDAHNSSLLQRF